VTGADPDQVEVVAAALASIAESGDVTNPPPGDVSWTFDMPLLVRHLVDDLRTYYHEAIASQPGVAPNHDALTEWIFAETALGETLQAVAARLGSSGDPMAKLVRGFVIPEGHHHGGSAF